MLSFPRLSSRSGEMLTARIFAMNRSCDPSGTTLATLHSMLMGQSAISGHLTWVAGRGVSLVSANLSTSRPDFIPHQSVIFACEAYGMLTMNSLVAEMMP